MAVLKLKTIGSRLFEDVVSLYTAARRGEDVDFALAKRDAERLARVDRKDACVVYLIIAAHEWDIESATYWADESIRLSDTAAANLNAMKTFGELNRPDLALPFAKRAFEITGAQAEFVAYSGHLLGVGHIHEYFQVTNEVTPALSEHAQTFQAEMQRVMDVVKQKGLTDERIAADFRIAYAVAATHKVRITELKHRVTYEMSNTESTYAPQLLFSGDLATEMLLEDELAAELCKDESWDPLSFNVEFVHQKQ